MKTKEVKYYDFDGFLIREKLMIRKIIDGKETIEEADYSCLARNIEELYFLEHITRSSIRRKVISLRVASIFSRWVGQVSHSNRLKTNLTVFSLLMTQKPALDQEFLCGCSDFSIDTGNST